MPLFAFAMLESLEGLSFASLLDKVPLGIVLDFFLNSLVFLYFYVSIKLRYFQSNDVGKFLWCRVFTGLVS